MVLMIFRDLLKRFTSFYGNTLHDIQQEDKYM